MLSSRLCRIVCKTDGLQRFSADQVDGENGVVQAIYLGDSSHESKCACSIAYSAQGNSLSPTEGVSTELDLIKDLLGSQTARTNMSLFFQMSLVDIKLSIKFVFCFLLHSPWLKDL